MHNLSFLRHPPKATPNRLQKISFSLFILTAVKMLLYANVSSVSQTYVFTHIHILTAEPVAWNRKGPLKKTETKFNEPLNIFHLSNPSWKHGDWYLEITCSIDGTRTAFSEWKDACYLIHTSNLPLKKLSIREETRKISDHVNGKRMSVTQVYQSHPWNGM